jgi:hypothetical protein
MLESVSGFDYWPSSCDGSWPASAFSCGLHHCEEIGEALVDQLKANEEYLHGFNTFIDG